MDIKEKVKGLVKEEEVIQLLRDIVKIPSHLGQELREKPISDFTSQCNFSRKQEIETYQQEVFPGRPNVVAVIRGIGAGTSLMFNGHIDTVPPFGMEAPFSAEVREGRIYGRGTSDMKSGVASMAYAMKLLKESGVRLKGDVVYVGVIDECSWKCRNEICGKKWTTYRFQRL